MKQKLEWRGSKQKRKKKKAQQQQVCKGEKGGIQEEKKKMKKYSDTLKRYVTQHGVRLKVAI